MTAPPPTTGRTREWMPRMWEGCHFPAWLRLLTKNRFAIGPRQLYIAGIITAVSALHSVLRTVQDMTYGEMIRKTPLRQAPIFILGHWRTGTTLLHELLILDERHNFPTTYECLEPSHFLLTEEVIKRWLSFLVPSRRPMDNMKAGWDRPQEDEFALCMLGQPSPYLTIAFPNHPPQDQDAFTLENLPAPARAAWKRAFLGFLKCVNVRNPRRLVLKSPTHTFRIRILLEMFPQAQFVHILRDPFVVFPSTVNLWRTLYETHGLQTPTYEGLEEYVYSTFERMHAQLEATRGLIPKENFHELRYEDLVRDPLGEMQRLYDGLNLGGFATVVPRLEAYLKANADYQTNRYRMSEEQRAEIVRRWGPIIQRQGYGSGA